MEPLGLALGFCVGLLAGGFVVWLYYRGVTRSRELAHAARMQESREVLEKTERKLRALSEQRAADLRRMTREEPDDDAGSEEPEEGEDEGGEVAEPPVESAPAPVDPIAVRPEEPPPAGEEAEDLQIELEAALADLEGWRHKADLCEREVLELRAETEKLAADLAESRRAFDVRDQDVEALLAANERWKSEVNRLRAAIEAAEAAPTPELPGGYVDRSEELERALVALAESEVRARESAEALVACEGRVEELAARAAEQAESLTKLRESAPPLSTDDLTRIRGIGAVFARRLIGIGIADCRDLAAADPMFIRQSLDLVDVARVKIEDWIEDAKDMVLDA